MKTRAIGTMLVYLATTINPVSAQKLTTELASDTAQFSKKPVATCVSKTTNKGLDLLQDILSKGLNFCGIHAQIAPKGAPIVAETKTTTTREITFDDLKKIVQDRRGKKEIPNPKGKQLIFIEELKEPNFFSKNNEFIISREFENKAKEIVGFKKNGKITHMLTGSEIQNVSNISPLTLRSYSTSDTLTLVTDIPTQNTQVRRIKGLSELDRQVMDIAQPEWQITYRPDTSYTQISGYNPHSEVKSTKKNFEEVFNKIPTFDDGKIK